MLTQDRALARFLLQPVKEVPATPPLLISFALQSKEAQICSQTEKEITIEQDEQVSLWENLKRIPWNAEEEVCFSQIELTTVAERIMTLKLESGSQLAKKESSWKMFGKASPTLFDCKTNFEDHEQNSSRKTSFHVLL